MNQAGRETDGRAASNYGHDADAEAPHGNERHGREHDHEPVRLIAIESSVAGNEDGEIEVRQMFELEDFGPSEAIERFRELGVATEK